MANDRALLLDFDGVVNSGDYINKLNNGDVIDPEMVELVNRVIRQTGCDVVISSTWRILHPLPTLIARLKEAGFQGNVIGVTPRHPNHGRGYEIQQWLAANPSYTNYVVLDDESFDMGPVMHRLVKTDFKTGMQKEHARMAVELFIGS